jgi:protein required for attachment to host cells
MKLASLQEQIRELATLPETDAPVISCYVAIAKGRVKDRKTFEHQLRSIHNAWKGSRLQDLAQARQRIEAYLASELLPDTKGVAVFSRAGHQPYFLPLQFHVAVPDWVTVDNTPNIYHLVELKDTYHRYVVMICSETRARILEVNLGSVTAQLWKERPELRQRVGREWTKEHYQNHRRDRTERFIKEKVEVLEKLMSAGGHTHLILAGHPTITGRVRSKLPKHLAEKLVDMVPASREAPDTDIVEATVASFIEQEEDESRAAAEEIERQIRTGGLAVTGAEASLHALRRQQADMLVIARSFRSHPGWSCTRCGFMGGQPEKPNTCPECDGAELQDLDVKETMVKLAEQQGCRVEVVNQSEPLTRLGGVGCLLRYRLPDEYL